MIGRMRKFLAFGIMFLALVPSCSILFPPEPLKLPLPAGNAPVFQIEEYSLLALQSGPESSSERKFSVDPVILKKRADLRSPKPVTKMAAQNQILLKFGYGLKQDGDYFQLYHTDELLLDQIIVFYPLSYNQKRDDFAMLVRTREGRSILVQRGRQYDWYHGTGVSFPPFYLGNELFSARWEINKAIVRRDEEDIFNIPAASQTDIPIKGFHAWENHWVLEVDGVVIVDGTNLNTLMALDTIHHFQMVGGKPFYFFEKSINGKKEAGISYAGWDMGTRYDEIIHYQWGEPAILNPDGNENMVWFFARRGDTWQYVEAGVFQANNLGP